MPETITVEQNPPTGVTAVLINQAHTYPDHYLLVDTLEVKMYEDIDWMRNIYEIARQVGPLQDNEPIWSYFQRLWWYNQVVFVYQWGTEE